jgi:hypothetical protein
MKEPTRLREDSRVPAEARALLGPARATAALPRAVRERSAARLDRALVLPAAAGVFFWLKGIALATGVVLVGVVVPHVLTTLRPTVQASSPQTPSIERAPVARALPLPRVEATVAVVPPATTTAITSPPTPAPAQVLPTPALLASGGVAAPVPSVAPVDSLTREAAMLEQARAAMARDPNAALVLLDAHRAEFPQGELAMERELVAVDALTRLGRTADARTRGEALLPAARGSIYEARLVALLRALQRH